MKDVIKAWDAIGKEPEERRHEAISPAKDYWESGKQEANRVASRFDDPSKMSVLDFGCGDGRVAVPLAEQFDVVYAVDGSRAMLDALPEIENLKPIHYTGRSLASHEMELVDVVFSHSVFIHNSYDDGCLILRHLAEVTRPGGLLLLQIPLYEKHHDPQHWFDVGVWTPGLLVSAAVQANLQVLEMYINMHAYPPIGVHHSDLQVLER